MYKLGVIIILFCGVYGVHTHKVIPPGSIEDLKKILWDVKRAQKEIPVGDIWARKEIPPGDIRARKEFPWDATGAKNEFPLGAIGAKKELPLGGIGAKNDLPFGPVGARFGQIAAGLNVVLDVQAGLDFVSKDCQRDLRLFANGVVNGSAWAWFMADGWGAPQAGYFQGDGAWEGSYDSCLSVGDWDETGKIQGLHCTTGWVEPLSGNFHGIVACVPKTCGPADVAAVMTTGVWYDALVIPPGMPILEPSRLAASCAYSVKDKEMTRDASAMAAIGVLSFFGLLLAIGTTYDVVITMKKNAKKKETTPMKSTVTSNGYKDHVVRENITKNGAFHNPAFDASNGNIPRSNNGAVPSPKQEIETATKKENKPSVFARLCCAFSLYRHMPRLLSFDHPPGSFRCLNGIRFLTFAWITLGHTFQLGVDFKVTSTVANMNYKRELGGRHDGRMFIDNMMVAVETFFVLSAFLTTVSFLKKLEKVKKPTCRMMGLFFFHRYWRLTPVYMLIAMFVGCLFQYLGAGPFYPTHFGDMDNCKKNIWANLLYINNMYPNDMCMGWTWYLANDFQFYVISPLFLLALYYKPPVGITFTVLAICGSLTSRIVLYTGIHTDPNGFDFWRFMTSIYFPPWTRSATYFMAMFVGYLMWRKNALGKVNMHPAFSTMSWLVVVGVSTMMVIIRPAGDCVPCVVVYNVLQGPVAALVVLWVIFACISGNGGFVNSILSWNGWVPLAKLCYTGYLIHPIVIYYTYYQNKVQLYMTDWTMMYMFFGHLLLTLGVSFVVSACLEVPFGALEKVMIPPEKTKPERPRPEELITRNGNVIVADSQHSSNL